MMGDVWSARDLTGEAPNSDPSDQGRSWHLGWDLVSWRSLEKWPQHRSDLRKNEEPVGKLRARRKHQWELLYDQLWASLEAQRVKNLPAVPATQMWSWDQEGPLEKGMAPHSSTLAWRMPWTEELGRLQPMGLQSVGHDWATFTHYQEGRQETGKAKREDNVDLLHWEANGEFHPKSGSETLEMDEITEWFSSFGLHQNQPRNLSKGTYYV